MDLAAIEGSLKNDSTAIGRVLIAEEQRQRNIWEREEAIRQVRIKFYH
jgi:hypothetical protein